MCWLRTQGGGIEYVIACKPCFKKYSQIKIKVCVLACQNCTFFSGVVGRNIYIRKSVKKLID